MTTALGRCLAPMASAEFLEDWWERRPLILKRGSDERFSDLVSLHDVDRIVASTSLRYPYFRLFRDGRLTPVEDTTTSRQLGTDLDHSLADLNAIYDHYAADGTIVLQAMERWWPPLTAFCRDLEQDLGFPTQAYVYLAPPDAQGAPAHYDTHDVFVLQVAGSKQWEVWGAPKPLPMRMSADDYDPGSVEAYARDHEPLHRVVLNAGESMYLPRGHVHKARAGAGGSLHVSIGIMVNRWIDALESVVGRALEACQDDVQYRESLPFGRHPGRAASAVEERTLRRLVDGLLDRLTLDEALTAIRQELVDGAAPSCRGRLLDLEALDTLAPDTVIRRRPDVMARVVEEGGSLRVTFGGRAEHFDPASREAVRFAMSRDVLRVGAIPGGLRADAQIALAQRLVAGGLFTIERRAGAPDGDAHG